jgi:2-methylcitrate dehydratase PrpD
VARYSPAGAGPVRLTGFDSYEWRKLNMQHTRKLAEFAASLRYEDLPADVVIQAKKLLLHTLAVSMAAVRTSQGQRTIPLGRMIGGAGNSATVYGSRKLGSCGEAVFVNGTMADILDWEDCSWTGHPSAAVIPVAIAIAEDRKADGKALIAAIVAGFETYQRIALAVRPTIDYYWKNGWGLTSWQSFGASVPAAKIIGFDAARMAQSLSLTGFIQPSPNAKTRSWISDMYHFNYGLAASTGLNAALIVESGINEYADGLDGDDGYWNQVSDRCDFGQLERNLGDEFLIMETLFKRWPANMWIQQPLDALDALKSEYDFDADEIVEIVISPNFRVRMTNEPEGFEGMLQAQYSIPHCLAAHVLGIEVGPEWFSETTRRNAKVNELAGRVRAEGDVVEMFEAFEQFVAGSYPEVTLTVKLQDGKEYSHNLHFPKGHARNPFEMEETEAFAKHCLSSVLTEKGCGEIVRAVRKLEDLMDVDDLTRSLRTELTV